MGLPALGGELGTLGVLGAGFFAGFIDAIVGGGGLIQLPALLAGYPSAAPATLLGTNKLGSICGTGASMLRYLRAVRLPWRLILPAAVAAFFAALVGANLARIVAPGVFRPLVPVMLTAVLIYVLFNRNLGGRHAPVQFSRGRFAGGLAAITTIGLYDGFFGPGTGSFLMLLYMRLYGFDFVHASAAARTVNVATNAGALLLFGMQGDVHWGLGVSLGACNAAGGILGTHTALKHGSNFIRVTYLIVVISLIAKTAVDALLAARPMTRL